MQEVTGRDFGRLEARVLEIRDDVKEVKELLEAQNGRIRTLENKQANSDGRNGVIAVLVSIATSISVGWFGRHL
jgi:hypothetical protein